MSVEVKICGLDRLATVDAAVSAGARMLGFVFYPPSPRNLTSKEASGLTNRVPAGISRVGLFVNPTKENLDNILCEIDLDLIQLHGEESPERVSEIKNYTNLGVIKVLKISSDMDLNFIPEYESVTDWLMFDARPPKGMKGALPGGNALSFDWNIIKGVKLSRPWILAGGLNITNVREAVQISGAKLVDVSSGVEEKPGVKAVKMIHSFINAVQEK